MAKATQDGRLLQISTPLGEDYLLLSKLKAAESLSELYEIEVELLFDEQSDDETKITPIPIEQILGQPVSVLIQQDDGGGRNFVGMVNRFTQAGRNMQFTFYKARIVPHVWKLTQNIQSRIFQQLSVPDILTKVFDGFETKFQLQATYKPRNYCTQYGESDFAFAARIMADEGIFFYFDHSDGVEKMIFRDEYTTPEDCPNKSEIPIYDSKLTGNEVWESSVKGLLLDYQLQSGKYTVWDNHFQLPGKKLDANSVSRFNVGGNQDLEVYDFPGGYSHIYDGIDRGGGEASGNLNTIFEDNRKNAKNRMLELDSRHRIFNIKSDCSSLVAGYRFHLKNHPNAEFNISYIVETINHEAQQHPGYIMDDKVENPYKNSAACIPHGSGHPEYRPATSKPKPRMNGVQTAFVVGPEGEEIFTDKYGRVKVQFHWDRDGKYDSNSACWMRVSQAWAGNGWGTMFIPRIGMEVIVDFLEGDPDNPIITGCVYNPEAMPPYTLPDEKTKSTIKSDSSKGGEGFNEIRFEDKAGEEQLFFHAEKDQDIRVKNDRREIIGNDRHLIVNRDKRDRVKRDEHRIIERDKIDHIQRDVHTKVDGKETGETTGTYSRKISGNATEEFGANYSTDTTAFHTIKAANIVLEADTAISMKVGGSFITISSAGICIKGSPLALINSGGAAIPGMPGTLVPPLDPEEAMIADNADPGSTSPTYENQQRQVPKWKKPSMEAPTHRPNSSKNDEKKSWIEVKLVDEAGDPVPGERYRVTLPDGSTLAEGTTDEKGEARVDNIDPGNCKITFPELHEDSWEEG